MPRLAAIAACVASLCPAADFDRDIAPLLRARCIACHGPALQSAGVRLDSRDAARRVSARVAELTAARRMPPAGPPLAPPEIAALRDWAASDKPRHWAFEPLRQPTPPRPGHPVDAFLTGAKGKLAPEADPAVLRRRIHLDLTGLPPEPGANPGVSELLASPRFAEKWARHWLDLARYADSDGYEQDQPRPHAWRYRDWVIRSLHANKPFDQFTIEQISGDLLPDATLEQRAGTGFHRNTLTSREGGIDLEELRTGQTADRAATVASVWLGLTFECARCHDHKYDPTTQRDFTALYAYFDSADERNIEDPVPGEAEPYRARRPEYEAKFAAIRAAYRVDEFLPRWESEVLRAMRDPAERLEWTQVLDYAAVFQDHCHDILRAPPASRTFRQTHDLTRVFLKYPGPLASLPDAKGVRFSEGYQKLEDLDLAYPGLSELPVMAQRATPRVTRIFQRGDFRSPGDVVTAATPAFLPAPTGGNRLDLARWIVSRDNPLTARVFVNRVWQELFGRGLAATPDDFGLRGDAPEQQDLLDWLACDFRDNGWNIKRLIETIVTSAAYRQRSDPASSSALAQRRLRLPAELIRDNALAAAGLLDARVGGPSVRPPMPQGAADFAYRSRPWRESTGPDRYRRGLYTFFWRSIPHPQLRNFDAPDSLVTCGRRGRSTTPLQALNLLNDPVFWEAAEALGRRMANEGGVDRGFQLALGRGPTPAERRLLAAYHARRSSWTETASVLLNLDEFVTRP